MTTLQISLICFLLGVIAGLLATISMTLSDVLLELRRRRPDHDTDDATYTHFA